MTCIQPRADRSGRVLRPLVLCGKPAGWTCSTCGDPLCEPCAHSFGHFPLPGKDAVPTNTDTTKGSVTRGWPARVQSGSDARPGRCGVLSRQRSAGQRRTR